MSYLRLIGAFGLLYLCVTAHSPLLAQSQLNVDAAHYPEADNEDYHIHHLFKFLGVASTASFFGNK